MSTIAHSSVSARGTGGGTGVPPVHPPTKHSPPPIPPDKEPQLYNAFFDGQSSLVDIAREFNLSVTHLVAWTTQQHVQTKLLNVAELGRTRARLLASEGCGRAVHTLDTISTFHMSDTGDARTTSAHAKRKDVSRKSATDTLKLGLLPSTTSSTTSLPTTTLTVPPVRSQQRRIGSEIQSSRHTKNSHPCPGLRACNQGTQKKQQLPHNQHHPNRTKPRNPGPISRRHPTPPRTCSPTVREGPRSAHPTEALLHGRAAHRFSDERQLPPQYPCASACP